MSHPQLPSWVKTILITGAGGFGSFPFAPKSGDKEDTDTLAGGKNLKVGTEVSKLLLERYPSVKLIMSDMRAPASLGDRTASRAADLSDSSQVASLFKDQVDAVIAFQGIMSGGSEADFELGYRVNVNSHVALLEAARKATASRKDGNKIIYVYTSGLAVYGGDMCKPEAFVDPETTPLYPETSYGTAKAIVELYAFDYTRKGFVDGRILRLPTVAIRSGAPSSAASSFISGLIREPLMGKPSECPVADGPDDPAMDKTPIYLSRASTVFGNIIYSLTIPAERFPKYSRTVNVPGITCTPRQIIEALEAVGGKKALDLVTYKKDPAVIHIMQAWPGAFDNKLALALGFQVDDPKTGFMDAVKDFQKLIQS